MNEIKKKIIEGIKLLNEECKQIPQENIIWVGVAGVCQGLGLSEGQMKNERKKIQTGCKRTYGRERRRMI